MKLTKGIALIFSFLFCSILNAQTKNDTIIKNDEPENGLKKVKIFTPIDQQQILESISKDFYKWSIKTDVAKFLQGNFGITGEYLIYNRLSAEVSLGITSLCDDKNSIIQTNFGNDKFDTSIYGTSITEGKIGVGSSKNLAIKYYLSKQFKGIDGLYLGLQYAHVKYNYTYTEQYTDTSVNFEGARIKSGINVLFGYQGFTKKRVSHEVGIIFGFNKVKQDFIDNIQMIQVNSNTLNYGLTYKIGFGN